MFESALPWLSVAALLGFCALACGSLPAHDALPDASAETLRMTLDWQPRLAFSEPWRAWSAVAVHYSRLHLAANLAGTALTAAFGIAAHVPARAALAWLVAWPLTQFGLLVEPGLLHFGGLSGVLHAGVMVVTVWLLARGTRPERQIALLVLVGLMAKLVAESPWGPPLRHPAGWDIATAPMAHLTGALAGAACGMLAMAWPERGRDNPAHD